MIKSSLGGRRALKRAARDAFRSRLFAEALDLAQQGAERFPEEEEFLVVTGRALVGLERYVEAEPVFRDLVETGRGGALAWLGLLQVYHDTRAWARCAETCSVARRQGVSSLQLLRLEGGALLELERLDAARAVFQELVTKAPKQPAGYLGVAHTALRSEDMDTVATIAERAAEAGVVHPQITSLGAQALFELRKFEALRTLLWTYFQETAVLAKNGRAGSAVTDRRVALPRLLDLYWKAAVGCGNIEGANRFRAEVDGARSQGAAMATLFGGFAAYLPFFDNRVLGDL